MRVIAKKDIVAVLSRGDRLSGLVNDDEWPLVDRILRSLMAVFTTEGNRLSPLEAMRVEELLVLYFTARRLEEPLRMFGVFKDASDGVPVPSPLVEAAAKARERLRKAVKELEEVAAGRGAKQAGAQSLAELLRPILKRAAELRDDDESGMPVGPPTAP